MRQEAGRLRQLDLVVIVALLILGVYATPAEAYIDPGTGSYLFQMALAALVSAGFLLRAYWRRILRFFGRQDNSERPPSDER